MVESSHSQLRKKNSWPGQAYNFIKGENLVQVFFSEFSEISNNNFFYRTPPVWLFLLLDEIQITKKMKTRELKERKCEQKVIG